MGSRRKALLLPGGTQGQVEIALQTGGHAPCLISIRDPRGKEEGRACKQTLSLPSGRFLAAGPATTWLYTKIARSSVRGRRQSQREPLLSHPDIPLASPWPEVAPEYNSQQPGPSQVLGPPQGQQVLGSSSTFPCSFRWMCPASSSLREQIPGLQSVP